MSIECAITGRLGQAVQHRTTSGGKRWASFSLAVGTGDETEWVQVSVFEPLLDELPADLVKGEKLYCEGKLKLNRWEGTEGPKARLQVAASTVLALDRIGRRRKTTRRKAETDDQDDDTSPESSPTDATLSDTNGRMAGDEIPF